MKRICSAVACSVLTLSLFGGVAFADDHHDDRDNHRYVKHEEWRRGYHMRHEDWDRGERVDYHRYHLHRPPSGYEWREVDGNYVLAAVATGVIASVVIAGAAH